MSGMWHHCLRCHADLGSNRVFETFPVGERIAFDGRKGRLWVVCPACGRWNLSPILSRWEAIETAERRFQDTRRRVSTDNIGLARLKEGLELVRLGEPLPDEFAAWRYADRFGQRRRKAIIWGGAALAGAGALAAAGITLGVATGALVGTVVQLPNALQHWYWNRQVVARVPTGDGDVRDVVGSDLFRTRPRRSEAGQDWRLFVPHGNEELELTGQRAMHVAGKVLTHSNPWGARKTVVQDAVAALAEHGGPDEFFDAALREAAREGHGYTPLAGLPPEYRLPLEMAAHEGSERRALEGELEELERAWREAEEIAAIADDLLLSEGVQEWIRRQRRRVGG